MSAEPPQPPQNPTTDLNGLSKDGVLHAVEEAKHQKPQYSPRDRAQYVRDRVNEVRRLRALGQNDEQIKEAVGDFVKNYPTLFQMAVEPNFNEANFRMMVGALEQMANGRLSQHEASVAVGQNLVDKYVMPLVQDKDKKKKH
jgi:hypothetical protein